MKPWASARQWLEYLGIRGVARGVPDDCYMLDEALVAVLASELGSAAAAFFSSISGRTELGQARFFDWADEFLHLYRERPVRENSGGSGFHNCFWLFITGRFLKPQCVVESGVLHGQTTWALERGSPAAEVHCFDLSFRKLQYRSRDATYHQFDWADFDFGEMSDRQSLWFFDDHVNQSKRIRQASERGFRWLVFDDCPPKHKLYRFGLPGFPTAQMIADSEVCAGDEYRWIWRGQLRKHTVESEDLNQARPLVASCRQFPDVASVTGLGTQTFLALVELNRPADESLSLLLD